MQAGGRYVHHTVINRHAVLTARGTPYLRARCEPANPFGRNGIRGACRFLAANGKRPRAPWCAARPAQHRGRDRLGSVLWGPSPQPRTTRTAPQPGLGLSHSPCRCLLPCHAGSSGTGFAYSIDDAGPVKLHHDYPDAPRADVKTLTAILYHNT